MNPTDKDPKTTKPTGAFGAGAKPAAKGGEADKGEKGAQTVKLVFNVKAKLGDEKGINADQVKAAANDLAESLRQRMQSVAGVGSVESVEVEAEAADDEKKDEKAD